MEVVQGSPSCYQSLKAHSKPPDFYQLVTAFAKVGFEPGQREDEVLPVASYGSSAAVLGCVADDQGP